MRPWSPDCLRGAAGATTTPRYLPWFFAPALTRWASYRLPDGERPLGWLPEVWDEPLDTANVDRAIACSDQLFALQQRLEDSRLPAATRDRLERQHAECAAAAGAALAPLLARGLERRCGRLLVHDNVTIAIWARLLRGDDIAEVRSMIEHDLYDWQMLSQFHDQLAGANLRRAGMPCVLFGRKVTLHVCDSCSAVFSGRANASRCRLCRRRPAAAPLTLLDLGGQLLDPETASGPRETPITRRVAKLHATVPGLIEGWGRETLRACAECRGPMVSQRADAKVCSKRCESTRAHRVA